MVNHQTARSSLPQDEQALKQATYGPAAEPIIKAYQQLFEEMAVAYPGLASVYSDQSTKFAAVFPALFVEHGYYAIIGENLPADAQKVALTWGLLCLYVDLLDTYLDALHTFEWSEIWQAVTAAVSMLHWSYHMLSTDLDKVPVQLAFEHLFLLTRKATDLWYEELIHTFDSRDHGFQAANYDVRLRLNSIIFGYALELGMRLANASTEYLAVARDFGQKVSALSILIDDMQDVRGDFQIFGSPVTLPMHLVSQGHSLKGLESTIEDCFAAAKEPIDILPHGDRIRKYVDYLQVLTRQYLSSITS